MTDFVVNPKKSRPLWLCVVFSFQKKRIPDELLSLEQLISHYITLHYYSYEKKVNLTVWSLNTDPSNDEKHFGQKLVWCLEVWKRPTEIY